MTEVDWNPEPRQLRVFAATGLAIIFAIGVALWLGGGTTLTGAILLGILAAAGVAGLVHPQSLRLVYVLSATLTAPIGWALSHLVIAVLFYLVITPVGLLMRASGRDPMELRKRRDDTSCWRKKSQPSGIDTYLRQ